MSNLDNASKLKQIFQKARDNKEKIRGLLKLKRKLERGEYLDLAIMAMLEKEHKNHPENSTLSNMEAIGGIQ